MSTTGVFRNQLLHIADEIDDVGISALLSNLIQYNLTEPNPT